MKLFNSLILFLPPKLTSFALRNVLSDLIIEKTLSAKKLTKKNLSTTSYVGILK